MRLTFLVCLALAAGIFSQETMEVVKNSGGSESIPLSTVTKITFNATDMVVGGANKSFAFTDIRVILFQGVNTSVEMNAQPSAFSFSNPLPNPFNAATGVRFGLIKQGQVRVSVHNMTGAKVRELVSGPMGAGNYEISWNGADGRGKPVAAGSYIIRLTVDGRSVAKKTVVQR